MSGYSQLEHAMHGELFKKKGSNPAKSNAVQQYLEGKSSEQALVEKEWKQNKDNTDKNRNDFLINFINSHLNINYIFHLKILKNFLKLY